MQKNKQLILCLNVKSEHFSPKTNRQGRLLSPLLFVLVGAIRKSTKCLEIGKKRNKTIFICRWHNQLWIKYQKFTKIIYRLIIDYIKVAGCKVNTQKTFSFLYNSSEHQEFEVKVILLTITQRKYFGINLRKYGYDIKGKS